MSWCCARGFGDLLTSLCHVLNLNIELFALEWLVNEEKLKDQTNSTLLHRKKSPKGGMFRQPFFNRKRKG